eukprot:GDKH01013046.1.p1 GENE.GDKH01013046.1~~GDKH01013046.1.p1  ORF type:complete len:78 (-),score=31.62 GDKH01013046.1:96-329(-)
MPKQVKDIKEFLNTARRKDAKSVKILKKDKQTKFKVRTARYLYTLVLNDKDKADRLSNTLPAGLVKTDLGKKAPAKK